MPNFLALLLFGTLLGSAAAAQDSTFETKNTISAQSGKRVQIAMLGRVTPSCENAPVRMRIAEKPAHGEVQVIKGTLKKGAIKKCPGLEAKTAIFFYTSKPDFKGNDSVAIVVDYEGRTKGEKYNITVK